MANFFDKFDDEFDAPRRAKPSGAEKLLRPLADLDASKVKVPDLEDKPEIGPWEAYKPVQAAPNWDAGEIGIPKKNEGKGVLGHARDLGLSAVKSAIAVPEAAVGLADIVTGGAAGKFLEENIGFRPKEAKEILSDLHTDQYKEQLRQFQDADGVLDKAAVALKNPSLIANTVVESAAPMLAGGVVARGVGAVAPKVGSVVGGAIGEGAMMAGSQAEAIRQETDDGLLTPIQAGAAVATGALGTLFGYAGGRLAKRLGIGDVDTMLARGAATVDDVAAEIAKIPAKSIPRQVIEGAIAEGFLEELPQSIAEQVIQNLALDKPWSEGIEDAAVMGTLAGMAMGGGASLVSGVAGRNRPAAEPGGRPQPAERARLEWEARQRELAQQEFGEPAVPQTPPPDGRAALERIRAEQERARLAEMEANRAVETPDDEIYQSVGIDNRSPSQRMGLDPSAGPLSAAAAQAVDSGLSPVASPLQQAAAQAQATGVSGSTAVDPYTGEILNGAPADPAAELQARLAFVEQQSRING